MTDERNDDLTLICETAMDWAGEYGWSPAMRPRCERIFEAVGRLRPELLGPPRT